MIDKKKNGARFVGYGYPFNGQEQVVFNYGMYPYYCNVVVRFTPSRVNISQCVGHAWGVGGGWHDGWKIWVGANGHIYIETNAVYKSTAILNTNVFAIAGGVYEVGIATDGADIFAIYVNGNLIGNMPSSSPSFANSNPYLTIGGTYNSAASNFYGIVWAVELLPYGTVTGNFKPTYMDALVKKHFNSGRGVDNDKAIKRSYNYGSLNFNYIVNNQFRRLVKSGNGFAIGGSAYTSNQGMTYQWMRDFYINAARRNGLNITLGVAGQNISSILKDYVFEGAQSNIQLNKTGKWERADTISTDLPASWAGATVNFNSNKWGGTTAAETTTSVITNAKAASFHASTQTPAGYDDVSFELAVNMTNLHMHTARKKRVALTSKNGAVRTIAQFWVYSNSLTQDASTLFDASTIIPAHFQAQSNPGLTGTVPVVEGMTYCDVSGTGISVIPSIPNSLNSTFAVQNCPVGQVPANFNNVAALYLAGSTAYGTVIATKCANFYITRDSTTFLLANSSAPVDELSVDLRNQAVNIAVFQANNTAVSKLKTIILPTTVGRVITSMKISNNQSMGLIDFSGVTWAMFNGTEFWMNNCNQNQVIPLGTVIRAPSIDISNNNMNEANVNSTLANWLDNQANFAAVGVVKLLYMSGSNAAPTARVNEIEATVESGNWIINITNPAAGVRTFNRINGFSNAVTDQLIIIVSSYPNYAAGATVFISNMGNELLNGTYTIVSRGTDAGATNNLNGQYYKIQKIGIGINNPNETGVISN